MDNSRRKETSLADIPLDQVPALLDWLIDLLDSSGPWVTARVQEFEERRLSWQQRPYKVLTSPEPNPLVPGIADYCRWAKAHRSDVVKELPASILPAATYAYYLQDLRSFWDSAAGEGRKRLVARLKGKQETIGLLFEIRTAWHYQALGYEMIPAFITEDSPNEILVSDSGWTVEVQCKAKSLGFGRKVPHQTFNALLGHLEKRIGNLSSVPPYAIIIRPVDRLQEKDLDALASTIATLRQQRWQGTQWMLKNRYRVTLKQLGPIGHKRPVDQAMALARPYVASRKERFHIAMTYTLHSWPPKVYKYVNPEFVACCSVKPDRVLRTLMRTFSEARDQLSSDLPGVVMICLSEPVDWAKLPANASLVQAVKSRFLKGGKWAKVGAIVFCSPDPLKLGYGTLEDALRGFALYNHMASRPLPEEFRLLMKEPEAISST